jgi:hypothetical protein
MEIGERRKINWKLLLSVRVKGRALRVIVIHHDREREQAAIQTVLMGFDFLL